LLVCCCMKCTIYLYLVADCNAASTNNFKKITQRQILQKITGFLKSHRQYK
jgi:transposase